MNEQYEILSDNVSRYRSGIIFELKDVIITPHPLTGEKFYKAVKSGTDTRLANIRSRGRNINGIEEYEVL